MLHRATGGVGESVGAGMGGVGPSPGTSQKPIVRFVSEVLP
jgi:hypothetical protein